MPIEAQNIELPSNARCRREFLLQWLAADQPAELAKLWRSGDQTRRQFVGEQISLWGTIKLSNYCDDDCGFCGLRAGN